MVLTDVSAFPANRSDGTLYSEITTTNIICAVLLSLTSLLGLVMNILYIWVLKFRMRQSVTTIWFFHLVVTNLIFTLDLPLMAVYVLRNPLWSSGSFMCKMNYSLVKVFVYAAVFFLTAVNLERFFLVYYPHWYRRYMTLRRASITCWTIWGVAVLCSSPYLVLCHVEQKGNITVCCATPSFTWEGDHKKTAWGLFIFHFTLSFILPFGFLSISNLLIGLKIRNGNLAKSTKPYRLISIVVVLFFITWTPYHVRNGMNVERRRFPDDISQILLFLTIVFSCINSCFTPILYLFIVDSFNKEFRKSVQLLVSLIFQ